MDLLDFVPEESEPVRMVQGIGENVDDGAPDGILAGSRYEIGPLEALPDQHVAQGIIGNLLPDAEGQERTGYLFLVRNRFLKGGRIRYDE